MADQSEDNDHEEKGTGLPESLLSDKRVKNLTKALVKFELWDILLHLIRISYPSSLPKKTQEDFNRANKMRINYTHRPLGIVIADYAKRICNDAGYKVVRNYFLKKLPPEMPADVAYQLLLQLVEEYFISTSPSSMIHSDMIMVMMLIFKDMIMAALEANNSLKAQELLAWFVNSLEDVTKRNSSTIYSNVRDWVYVYDSLIDRKRSLHLVTDKNLIKKLTGAAKFPATLRCLTASSTSDSSADAGPQTQPNLCWTLGTGASTLPPIPSHPPTKVRKSNASAPSTAPRPATVVTSQPAQQPTIYCVVQPVKASTQAQTPSTGHQIQIPIVLSAAPDLTNIAVIQQPQQGLSQQNQTVTTTVGSQSGSTQAVVPPTLVLRQPAATVVVMEDPSSQPNSSQRTGTLTTHGLYFKQSIVTSASKTQNVVLPKIAPQPPATTSYSTIQVRPKVQKPLSIQTGRVATTNAPTLVLRTPTAAVVTTVQTTSTATTTTNPITVTAGASTSSTLPQSISVQLTTAVASSGGATSTSSTSEAVLQPTAGTSNANQTREYTSEHLQSLADGVGLTLTDWHLLDSRVNRQDPSGFSTEEIVYYLISCRLANLPAKACDVLKKRMEPADLAGTRLGVVLNDYFAAIAQSTSFRQMIQEFGANVSSTQIAQNAFRDFLMTRILPRTEVISFDRMMAAVLLAVILAIKSIKQGNPANAMFVLRLATAALEITDHRRDIVRNGWALMQAAREDLVNRSTFDLFYSLRSDGSIDVSQSEANIDADNQISPYLAIPAVSQGTSQAMGVLGPPIILGGPATFSSTTPLAGQADASTGLNSLMATSSPMRNCKGSGKRQEISQDGDSNSKDKGSPSKDSTSEGKHPAKKKPRNMPEQNEAKNDVDNNDYFNRLAQSGVISQEEAKMQQAIATTLMSSANEAQEESSTSQPSTSKKQDKKSPSRGESSSSKVSPSKKKPRNDPEQSEPEEDVDDNYYFNRLAQSGVISQEEVSMQQAIAANIMSSGAQVQEESSKAQASTSTQSDSQIKGDSQSIVESSQGTKKAGDLVSETDSYTTADTELVDAGQTSVPVYSSSAHACTPTTVQGNSSSGNPVSNTQTRHKSKGSTSADSSGRPHDGGGRSSISNEKPSSSQQAESPQTKQSQKKSKKPKQNQDLSNKQKEDPESDEKTRLCGTADTSTSQTASATARRRRKSDDGSSEDEAKKQAAILESYMF